MGQIDLVIKLSYVVFLGIIGGLMLLESAPFCDPAGQERPPQTAPT